MPTPARTEGPAWDELRDASERLHRLASGEAVALIDLGKAYARLSRAMLGAAKASGQTSMRFEAAVRALDLKTKKSALTSFLEG